jgi:glycosyltransferase involved in cell wall biosynthesis
MNPKVSIVMIGRNEERSIGKCVEAALAAAKQIGGAEMLYVDSNSTDQTAAVVESYGVNVLRLSPGLRPSPSAGRFMGSLYARGDFILFLDADTWICPDFLPEAVKFLEDNFDVGGVNGYIDDFNESGEQVFGIDERSEAVADVRWLRGPCCFYRSEALRQAGPFNPHLATEEEAELGLRLVGNGWKLRVLPRPMARHTRCYHGVTMESVITTFRRDMVSKRLGEITRTIACAFNNGNGFAFCWLRLRTTILFLVWSFAIALCFFLPDSLHPGIVIVSLVLLGGSIIFVKKRSFSQTLLFIPSKILNVIDILAGLHKIAAKEPRILSLENINRRS